MDDCFWVMAHHELPIECERFQHERKTTPPGSILWLQLLFKQTYYQSHNPPPLNLSLLPQKTHMHTNTHIKIRSLGSIPHVDIIRTNSQSCDNGWYKSLFVQILNQKLFNNSINTCMFTKVETKFSIDCFSKFSARKMQKKTPKKY